MRHKKNQVIIIALVAIVFSACATSQEPAAMTAADAQKIIADFKTHHGSKLEANATSPTSMVEVFEIVQTDDISRFEAARQFAMGKKGIEVLSIRASLQIFWAGAQLGIASLLGELALSASEEALLITKRKDDGLKLSDGEKARLKKLKGDIEELKQVSEALNLLARTHLKAGETLASEAIRQYPDKPDGYLAKANFHRLRAEWTLFTEAITRAEKLGGAELPGVLYLRAMERIQRFDLRNEGIALLMELRYMAPEYLRVQAALVLMQTDIVHAHEELEKLKALSPNHPVVLIAGPMIEEEFETSAALRQVRQ